MYHLNWNAGLGFLAVVFSLGAGIVILALSDDTGPWARVAPKLMYQLASMLIVLSVVCGFLTTIGIGSPP